MSGSTTQAQAVLVCCAVWAFCTTGCAAQGNAVVEPPAVTVPDAVPLAVPMTTMDAHALLAWVDAQESVSADGRVLIVTRMSRAIFDGYAIGEAGMEGRDFVGDLGDHSGALRRLLFPREAEQKEWIGPARVEQLDPMTPGGRKPPPLPTDAEARAVWQEVVQQRKQAEQQSFHQPAEPNPDPSEEDAAAAAAATRKLAAQEAANAARMAAIQVDKKAFTQFDLDHDLRVSCTDMITHMTGQLISPQDWQSTGLFYDVSDQWIESALSLFDFGRDGTLDEVIAGAVPRGTPHVCM